MTAPYDWQTGEGLTGLDDPAAVDAAFDRDEPQVGTAVVGLAFHCPVAVSAPRIVRAIRRPEPMVRGQGFVAASAAVQLHGELTPQLYSLLREEGFRDGAEIVIRDVLTFVPFRRLPLWFRWMYLVTGVRDFLQGRWLRIADAAGDAWAALRRRLRRR